MTVEQHAVIYTDAGFLAKSGAGGWGIHGYVYDTKETNKGSGCTKAAPTKVGYVPNSERDKHVKVNLLSYVDGVGPVYSATSSTHTELVACKRALDHLADKDYKSAAIKLDNESVVKGLNLWLPKWEAAGWKTGTGKTLANKTLWQETQRVYETVKAKMSLDVSWVRGHAGDFGNETTDSYARRGNVLTMNGSKYDYLKESPAAGYWSPKVEFNKLLANARWYYSTLDLNQTTPCGKTVYHLGSHGKEDFEFGKATPDTDMAVVILNEPDPVLEQFRKTSYEMDTKRKGYVMIARLDHLLVPANYKEILDHGVEFMLKGTSIPNNDRLDLLTHEKSPVVREQTPPGLAFMACSKLNMLERKLLEVMDNDIGISSTDITDLIFTSEVKGKRTVYKVLDTFTQSVRHLDVDVDYCLLINKDRRATDTALKDATGKQKVRLLVDGDIARRNVLSNLAGPDTKVFVITWRESPSAFRYATVIQTPEGWGIWSNIDSNIQLVDTK